MLNKYEILSPGSTYHVYNRANGNEKMFVDADNYEFFLKQYQLYLGPFVDTFCYCLISNHFHLLIRVKEEKEILLHMHQNRQGFASAAGRQNLDGFPSSPTLQTIEKIISNQFSKFFTSYSKSFNSTYNRKGSIFMKSFKRILVKDQKYLLKLVHYIHHNPVEARLCSSPEKWKYSSYPSIINGKNDLLNTKELIDWFDDLNGFKDFHKLSVDLDEQ